MSKIPVLKNVDTDHAARTAAMLRELADQAERGEILSVTVVAMLPGGRYRTTWGPTKSRLEAIGALFDAAVERAVTP